MADTAPAKKIKYLKNVNIGEAKENYSHVLLPDEEVIYEFKGSRDSFIMTDRKVILIDTQGFTGKKKETLVVPYSKISAFSVESAGFLDLDAEMKLWASGIGFVELGFIKGTVNITDVTELLAKHVK